MNKSTRVTVDIDGYGERVIVATWQGGPYVDLHWDWAQSPAFEVLNVWDYETGACEIPFTREALRGKLLGFVHDPETDLANYSATLERGGRWS